MFKKKKKKKINMNLNKLDIHSIYLLHLIIK
jgi:hypothetical protein